MTTARTEVPLVSAAEDVEEIPWYDLINEVPEPPEDGLVEDAVITLIKAILVARYADDPTTLVLGPTTFLIYDSDVPGSLIAPDCYVMFGVDADFILDYRHSYRIEEWGVIPAFALEVASPSTARRDLTEKRELYARIGIQEYWRLDRFRENYGEPLVGERLVDGEYVRFDLHTETNGDTWSRSEVLGVDFYYRVDDDGYPAFLLRDSVTDEWLHDLGSEIAAHAETEAARHAAEMRAQDEQQMRQEAEARTQDEQQMRQEAEAARQEAEARNQELQAELQRLRQQLDKQ